jgi:hypothetical protein
MPYPQRLMRRRVGPWDETLPDGRSVDEAVRQSSGRLRLASPPADAAAVYGPPQMTGRGQGLALAAPTFGAEPEAPESPSPRHGPLRPYAEPAESDSPPPGSARLKGLMADRAARASRPVESPNSRIKSIGLGLLRGWAQGGLPGLIFGGVSHAADPTLDEQYAQRRDLARYDDRIAAESAGQKLLGDLREQQADIGVKEANREWLLQKPGIEQAKAEQKRRYDEWRMRSQDRKADTYENFLRWRMEDGDRRAATAEGQLELRREWNDFLREDRNRNYDFNVRRQASLEDHRAQMRDIAREANGIRAAALARGVGREEAAAAAAEYEADLYDQMADGLDAEMAVDVAGQAAVGSAPLSEDEQKERTRRLRELRSRSQMLRARAVKPRAKAEAGPAPRPKNDPLGIFN